MPNDDRDMLWKQAHQGGRQHDDAAIALFLVSRKTSSSKRTPLRRIGGDLQSGGMEGVLCQNRKLFSSRQDLECMRIFLSPNLGQGTEREPQACRT